jgi:hypothetical protein
MRRDDRNRFNKQKGRHAGGLFTSSFGAALERPSAVPAPAAIPAAAAKKKNNQNDDENRFHVCLQCGGVTPGGAGEFRKGRKRNYPCVFFFPNSALILSNSSILAPCLRMMIDCCATDSVLFQAQ